jgi:hypothetical protein
VKRAEVLRESQVRRVQVPQFVHLDTTQGRPPSKERGQPFVLFRACFVQSLRPEDREVLGEMFTHAGGLPWWERGKRPQAVKG